MKLFVSPKDSEKLYPTNSSSDFIVELPQALDLQGTWVCGLIQVFLGKSPSKKLYLYCDLVEASVIQGKLLPVLRILSTKKSEEYLNPLFLPITRNRIERVRFTIKNKSDELAKTVQDLGKEDIILVLELKRVC